MSTDTERRRAERVNPSDQNGGALDATPPEAGSSLPRHGGRADWPRSGRGWERQLELTEQAQPRDPAPSQISGPSDRAGFYIFAALVLAALIGLAISGVLEHRWSGVALEAALAWCGFTAAANLLPVPAGPTVYLSMSAPVNIAIAVVFPPSVAGTLVALSSFSEWELAGRARLSHSVFNRCQLGLSTAAAGAIFALRTEPTPWTVLTAVGVYHGCNWALVAIADRTARGTPVSVMVAKLMPRGFAAAATYLALGIMGVALGLAYVRIGTWAVALLMIPLVGSRSAIQAARDIERMERERRLVSDRLIEERERERLRIAAKLHDRVLQDLASLQVRADNVLELLGETDPRVQRQGKRLRTAAARSITDIREAISDLRHSPLDHDGLSAALGRYARNYSRQTGLDVQVSFEGIDSVALPPTIALLIFECCQEALTNVVRHAHASSVQVELERLGRVLELRVRDNGVGYRRATDPEPGRLSQGLALMRERLASYGGGCWIRTWPDKGTQLVARVPVGMMD